MSKRHWQDAVNVGLGLWLFASAASFLRHAMANAPLWHLMTGAWPPEAVGIAAMWSLAIVGVAVAFVAFFAWLAFGAWQEWINLAFGIWLFVSPWVFGFPASAGLRWNAVITGTVVAGLAVWVLMLERGSKPAVR
jgi:hypothetical protein